MVPKSVHWLSLAAARAACPAASGEPDRVLADFSLAEEPLPLESFWGPDDAGGDLSDIVSPPD